MATRVAVAAAVALAMSYVIASRMRKKSVRVCNAFQGTVRLPTLVSPRRYDLELTPKLKECKFDGKLSVTVNITEDTKNIVMNAADLTINDKSVWLRGNVSRQVTNGYLDGVQSTIKLVQVCSWLRAPKTNIGM